MTKAFARQQHLTSDTLNRFGNVQAYGSRWALDCRQALYEERYEQ
jgi:hypothetical protein